MGSIIDLTMSDDEDETNAFESPPPVQPKAPTPKKSPPSGPSPEPKAAATGKTTPPPNAASPPAAAAAAAESAMDQRNLDTVDSMDIDPSTSVQRDALQAAPNQQQQQMQAAMPSAAAAAPSPTNTAGPVEKPPIEKPPTQKPPRAQKISPPTRIPAIVTTTQQPPAMDNGAAGENVPRASRYPQREKRPARPKVLEFDPEPEVETRRGRGFGRRITMGEMQRHLSTLYVGLRPGDPTVTSLPNTLPPPVLPQSSDTETIHLAYTPQERLMEMAAATRTHDCFEALLENQPGAPKDRLGYFTGQGPEEQGGPNAQKQQKKRQERRTGKGAPRQRTHTTEMSAQEIIEALKPFFEESRKTEEIPWTVVGKRAAFKSGGKTIPLRGLYEAVEARGGYDQVTQSKLWSETARSIGLDPTSKHNLGIKGKYARYLLPWEQFTKFGMPLTNEEPEEEGEEPPQSTQPQEEEEPEEGLL